MSPKLRAGLMLVATLLIGVLIGFLGAGVLGQRRAERFERLRDRGGFTEHMLGVIGPRDEAQRREIVPYLERTARSNREIIEGTRGDLAAEIDSLKVRLAPILDAEQMHRLEDAGRMREMFRGPGERRRGAAPPPGPGPRRREATPGSERPPD